MSPGRTSPEGTLCTKGRQALIVRRMLFANEKTTRASLAGDASDSSSPVLVLCTSSTKAGKQLTNLDGTAVPAHGI